MGIKSLRDGIDKFGKNLSYDFWNTFQSIHPVKKEMYNLNYKKRKKKMKKKKEI
jgi:hypothetical protein